MLILLCTLLLITGYLLQHDDIISLDVHFSGAKVRRNFDISKDAGGAGQNLICNSLSVSGLVLPSLTSRCRVAQPNLQSGWVNISICNAIILRPSGGLCARIRLLQHIPTLPTLTLSIKGLRARYPTLEATLTPTLENLSTTFTVQPLFLQFSREFARYSMSNFR